MMALTKMVSVTGIAVTVNETFLLQSTDLMYFR